MGSEFCATGCFTVFACLVSLQARKLNASGMLDPPLPSLGENDFVYTTQNKDAYASEWVQAFLRVVAGPAASIEYKDTIGANWDTTNWVCFKNAVMTGTVPSTVSAPLCSVSVSLSAFVAPAALALVCR